jgi:RNA polymerase sigma-70 factor (ECF subfamily)
VRATTLEQVTQEAPTEDFSRVFEEHAPFVQRALRKLGVREADAEDVSQEVFLVVHRRLPTFDRTSTFSTWLYGICIRAAANYRRRARLRREDASALPPELGMPADQLDALVRRRNLALLDTILDQLDEDKRVVFVLYEVEQVPMTEVAKASGCPLQTAYSRLYAARRHVESSLRRVEAARKGRGAHAASLGVMFPWMLPSAFSGALVGGGLAVALLCGVTVWSAMSPPAESRPAITAPAPMAAAPRAGGAPPLAADARSAPPDPPALGHEARGTKAPRAAGVDPSPAAIASPGAPDHAEVAPFSDAEVLLLRQARGALATAPTEALSLTDQHAARFSGGRLTEERELIAVSALVALGRRPDAHARAARFFERFPSSAHRRRIDLLLSPPRPDD